MATTDDVILQPQNLEAEEAILGAILMDPKAIDRVIPLLQDGAYYKSAHNRIYSAMLELRNVGESIDTVTLTNHLTKSGLLEKVGGAYYLTGLVDALPSAANVEHYARIVREKWEHRRIIAVCRSGITAAMSEDDPETLSSSLVENLTRRSKNGYVDFTDPADELKRSIAFSMEHPGTIAGLTTSLKSLDRYLSGILLTDLILLGGRPSTGKTALALGMTAHIAKKHGPVYWGSAESGRDELLKRAACQIARVDSNRIGSGFLTKAEAKRLNVAADDLKALPIYIDDSAGQTWADIAANARHLAASGGLKAVFVDYMQRLNMAGLDGENRNQKLEDLCNRAKDLNKSIRSSVFLLSQLSREIEKRPPSRRRPIMSDLRDSGAAEQAADKILMLYRPEMYMDERTYEDGASTEGIAEISVQKNRNGRRGGVVKVHFEAIYTAFSDIDLVHEEPPSRQKGLGTDDIPF